MQNIIKNNKIVNLIFFYTGSFILKFIGMFIKVDNHRILFSSGMGKGIFDSPLVIYEEMKNDPYFDKYSLIWAVKDVDRYKNEFDVVKIDTLKYFYYCLSSKVWITSVNIERGLKFKKRQTIYLNTWHGVPLKTIGLDVKARHDYDFSHVDLFLSSGSYENKIYQRAFNLKKDHILNAGNPRNIELYNLSESDTNLYRNDYFTKLNLLQYENKKVILFAPTWRDYPHDAINLDYIIENISSDYTILVKSHPLEKIKFQSERVIDVSAVGDIVDILPIVDILISDYSSVMIDFSILRKAIVAYVPDFDTYKKLRGLYVSKKELAPNVVTTEGELVEIINHIDMEVERNKTSSYHDSFLEEDPRLGFKNLMLVIKEKLDKDNE